MRVLMTGGYGCIGSWVARQLVEEGGEVWIFDLKEDRHRLDLLLDDDGLARVHFVPGRRLRRPGVLDGGRAGRGDAPAPPGRAPGPDLPGRPAPRGPGQRPGDARRLRGRLGPEGPGRAGRLRQLGGRPRPGRPRPTGPIGDEVRLAPLTHYGAFKVCNELNARVYWLDRGITSVGLRPWTVYGVGRDFGVTSEPTKAIKAVAAGRSYAISYGGLQDLQYVGDVAATFLRRPAGPVRGGRRLQRPGRGRPDGGVRRRRSARPRASTG